MSTISEFVDMVSYAGIFSEKPKQSQSQAQNVSDGWYAFSSFIPDFLKNISDNVGQVSIKERIKQIIFEELGEGNDLMNHARLFYYSQAKLDRKPVVKEMSSIVKLNDSYNNLKNKYNAEAFSIGVSFGLEIIAEENISYLMSLCSTSENDKDTLNQTAFFKIHLVNEIEHINKCFENYKAMVDESKKLESFYAGLDVSLNFWQEFWKEAIHG